MRIDRCICHDRTFVEIRVIARDEKLDLDGLVRRGICGDACGLCRRYVREMLRTGQTEFELLLSDAQPADRDRPGHNIA